MINEGVAETSSLADALKLLLWERQRAEKILPRYFAAALSRLLQSLQNFGQVAAFSVLPAAFVSFHSSAHFFWRSRAASWPALGSVFVLAVFSDAFDY